MKIIVYNSNGQYALSRKQVEILKSVLPNEYFESVREFHITHARNGSEVFEYQQTDKKVYFAFTVQEKTAETTGNAVEELLIGLARIKSNTLWGKPIKLVERDVYMEFVNSWKQKCINAISH